MNFKNRASIFFIILLSIFGLFNMLIFYSKITYSATLGNFNVSYIVNGNLIEISPDSFYLKGQYQSNIEVQFNISSQVIIVTYTENYRLNFFEYIKSSTYYIDPETGKDQDNDHQQWILMDFQPQIILATNLSPSEVLFQKSQLEVIDFGNKIGLILCQVYTHIITVFTQALIISYYYDINSKILLKYEVSIRENLVSEPILTCTIINSNYSGFARSNLINLFFINYNYMIISIVIGILVSLLTGKLLYNYKKGVYNK
ncbi:MAG: hypothetical protein ACTSXT_08940 [Candidatus Helarchaeota archaeon]